MSENGRVWTIHISGSPKECISFPQRDVTDPESPYRELTETENAAFELICNMLISVISQLPAGENHFKVVIPTDLGPLSNAMVTHIFNWLKLNNWMPLTCDDYFRNLSAIRT